MSILNAGTADPVLAGVQAQLLASKGGRLSESQMATLMSLAPSAVHIDTALSNMLIRYENREFIADAAMPVVTVSKRSDKIFEFPVDTMQTVAQVQLAGNRGRPGEISYSLSTKSYAVSDYGLMDFVSYDEEANADAPLMPRLASAEILMNFLMLAREIRVAGVVFSTANFSGNTSALAGGARWDTSTGTPVQNLLDAISLPFVRPNTLIMGEQAWVKFRNNAEVKSYVTGRAATSLGAIPFFMDEDTVAKAFGLDRVIVGRAKYNTGREGAAVASTYIWGKSAALLRVEPQPNARKTQCFGYTFRFGPMQNQVIPDLIPGTRGGNYIKISHSDTEAVVAGTNAGYLYTTVVS